MSWAEVLGEVEARLDPEGRVRFARLHKSFVSYLSQDTLDRFYGFVFAQGLHMVLNGYRFHRLAAVLDRLLPSLAPGLAILDIGAGAGIVSRVLERRASPRLLMAQDPCKEVRACLSATGFKVLPHPPPAAPPEGPFDLLLCVDSLGEVNADDDRTLARAGDMEPDDLADLPARVEERYGFAHKLEPWKTYLAPGGAVRIFEPIAEPRAWEAIAAGLSTRGWRARFPEGPGKDSYLELTLA